MARARNFGGRSQAGPFDTRFWAKVDKGEPWECWPWIGTCLPSGYGRVWTLLCSPGEKEYAHRVAYRLALKVPLEPEVVMHSCDNPACCNPAHLNGGAQVDNMADCVRKGRQAQGIALPQTKLSDHDVRSIRASTERNKDICRRYGISSTHAGGIRSLKKRGNVR